MGINAPSHSGCFDDRFSQSINDFFVSPFETSFKFSSDNSISIRRRPHPGTLSSHCHRRSHP